MKNLLFATLVLISVAVSAQEYAPYPPQPHYATTSSYGRDVQATVIQVTPIFEQVVVGQNCVPVTVYAPQPSTLGPVGGGVLGAVIGSRFGGGHGQQAAIAAGAIAGTMIGSQPQHPVAVTRHQCTPVVQVLQTQNSYVAEFNGFRFSGRTFRPLQIGDKVYVQVNTSVTPNE